MDHHVHVSTLTCNKAMIDLRHNVLHSYNNRIAFNSSISHLNGVAYCSYLVIYAVI